ncbi:MAG: type III-B CRISPR module-associated protein Cmr3 [Thermoguttaceae bacterium]
MNQSTSASGGQTVALRFDPLDVLFFRDGRPFTEASRGQSGLPPPQTLAGALRTHLLRGVGCDSDRFGRLAEQLRDGRPLEEAIDTACGAGWIARVELRGPWLARDRDGQLEVLVPLPANIQQVKKVANAVSPAQANGGLVRLDPLPPHKKLPGWQPILPDMRPLWARKRVHSQRTIAYLDAAGLAAYLAGQTPAADALVAPQELYAFDHRTGIALQPEQLTAAEGLIYTVSLLALRRGVTFYAEVALPADAPATVLDQEAVLDFGGEGRKVRVQPVPPVTWPSVESSQEGRVLLLLTTPAVFAERWRPRLPDGLRLVAAAVSGYEAFSGWDLARGGPKPTRFAVPAGSVYFLESTNGQSLSSSLAESDEDRRLGYGCVIQGVWNYV